MRRHLASPVAFLSSSFKDLRREREFAPMVLAGLGWETLAFPENRAGSWATDYLERLDDADLLVYIASRHSDAVRNELDKAERLGLPVVALANGPLSKEAERYRATSGRDVRRFQTLGELKEKLEEAMKQEVADRFASRLIEIDDVYEQSLEWVARAQRRLGVVQRTPSLVLGPRRDRDEPERAVIAALWKKLHAIKAGRTRLEVILGFDLDTTQRVLSGGAKDYPDARKSINRMKGFFTGKVPRSIQVVALAPPVTQLVLHDSFLHLGVGVLESAWMVRIVGGPATTRVWRELKRAARASRPNDVAKLLDSL